MTKTSKAKIMTKELSFTLCSTCICAAVGGPWNHDAKYLMDQHGLLGLRGPHNCHLSVIFVRFGFVSCCWPCSVGVLAVLVSGVMQLSAPCLLLDFTGATAQPVLASEKLSHSFLFSSFRLLMQDHSGKCQVILNLPGSGEGERKQCAP